LDTTPPVVTASAGTRALWPPNGKMVAVAFAGSITDTESAIADATYAVIDEYGQVQPSGTIDVDANGNYVVIVSLESRRHGNDRDGRTYALVVTATDASGNSSSASATTVVLHDRRGLP
jgi:hypothetical protein